jgi:pimeloyl-ACP methyl ester carboxylesterase
MVKQQTLPFLAGKLQKTWSPRIAILPAAIMLAVLHGGFAPGAQDAKPAPKKDAPAIPAPEEVTLITSDGVQMIVTYYPGTKGGESVPVVMLHSWKGKGSDYRNLAQYLQKTLGCAVILPDLRGHGGSTTRKFAGRTETLAAANQTPRDIQAMVDCDMIAVREFLRQRNNTDKLNLNKMCLVGSEMGATVALLYANLDAQGYMEGNPPGSTMYGTVQVGGFVKAMVLLSPEWSFKGVLIKPAMDNTAVTGDLAALILVGAKNSKLLGDAKKINAIFEKYHPKPANDPAKEKQTLFFSNDALDTDKQGTRMLDDTAMGVEKHIGKFIELRLIKSSEAKSLGWKKILKPHEKEE